MIHYRISFAGAGRLAGALCRNLFNSGVRINQIVSENESSGKPLADLCKARWSTDLIFNDPDDVIFVAVPDNRLIDVLSGIKCNEKSIVAHTAGSYGLDIFPSSLVNAGVFYPLQSFSKGRNISFKDIPVFLEAKNAGTGDTLKRMAELIGAKVYYADTERRKLLHVSAVFINNFTNFMLTEGKEIAARAGFSFDTLFPLLNETILKVLENGPEASQTGPAIRNDLNTIEKHLELLSFSPDLQKLYAEVTKSIISRYKSGA